MRMAGLLSVSITLGLRRVGIPGNTYGGEGASGIKGVGARDLA